MSECCKQNKKPILGVKPCYIASYSRITDLAEAIVRHSNECERQDLIKMWAKEIVAQCDLLEKMEANE